MCDGRCFFAAVKKYRRLNEERAISALIQLCLCVTWEVVLGVNSNGRVCRRRSSEDHEAELGHLARVAVTFLETIWLALDALRRHKRRQFLDASRVILAVMVLVVCV